MPSVTGDWDNYPEKDSDEPFSPKVGDGHEGQSPILGDVPDGIMVGRQSFMPRRGHGYPVSRDWADVDCKAVGCRYNRAEKCMVPSRCKIGDDGRCKGFEPSPMINKKPDGD